MPSILALKMDYALIYFRGFVVMSPCPVSGAQESLILWTLKLILR
jgi:hypothetical protein